MTHPFLCITIFILASFIWGAFIAATLLIIFGGPRYVAPTKRRKNRDRKPEVTSAEPAEVGGIRYEHLGITGLEE